MLSFFLLEKHNEYNPQRVTAPNQSLPVIKQRGRQANPPKDKAWRAGGMSSSAICMACILVFDKLILLVEQLNWVVINLFLCINLISDSACCGFEVRQSALVQTGARSHYVV